MKFKERLLPNSFTLVLHVHGQNFRTAPFVSPSNSARQYQWKRFRRLQSFYELRKRKSHFAFIWTHMWINCGWSGVCSPGKKISGKNVVSLKRHFLGNTWEKYIVSFFTSCTPSEPKARVFGTSESHAVLLQTNACCLMQNCCKSLPPLKVPFALICSEIRYNRSARSGCIILI